VLAQVHHGKLPAGQNSGCLMDMNREELLDQIKQELGLVEREADEFTGRELAGAFNTSFRNLRYFLESNEIKYTRRKALADGRRQYVYRIERIKL
jgi:hypothetical protein